MAGTSGTDIDEALNESFLSALCTAKLVENTIDWIMFKDGNDDTTVITNDNSTITVYKGVGSEMNDRKIIDMVEHHLGFVKALKTFFPNCTCDLDATFEE